MSDFVMFLSLFLFFERILDDFVKKLGVKLLLLLVMRLFLDRQFLELPLWQL